MGDDRKRGPLTELFDVQAGVTPGGLTEALTWLLRAPDTALPLDPADNRSIWSLDSGRADRKTIRDVLERAEQDRSQPWPMPLASAAVRVHRDGDRDEWEQRAFSRQRRLSRATVAAAATLDDHWIDEVADGVVLLCEQSSWCWPAHDDSFRAHGSVLATVTDPFLDLGASEVVAQLAWIDHLLGSQLDARYPGLRGRIRHEAHTRIFEPFVRRRDWHWIGLDGDVHNWNPWIHGNVLVAALRLLDAPAEETERARVVGLAIEGIDRYVASLPDDGAIDEGYAYWWNGACRALEALEVLSHATNGRLDAGGIPSIRATVAFPHSMHLGGAWYLNLADGQSRPPLDQPWHALHRAARRVGDPAAEAHAAAHRMPGRPAATESEGLGRLLRGVTDPSWIEAAPAQSPLPLDVWFPSTQVLLARQYAGSTAGLTLAVKGGHNGEHHNHNDVGSFIVASDGVPVIVDAGRPTYTAATFGPDRFSIWTMQSSWHNVPEIQGEPQAAGSEYAATALVRDVSDDRASLALELSGVYRSPRLHSWRRDARLYRRDTTVGGRVVIRDKWELEPADGNEPLTTVRMLIAGEVNIAEGFAHVVPLGGATPVRLSWPGDVPARLTVQELDDPVLSEVWGARLTRIDLVVADRNDVSVTVELDTPTGGEDG